MSKYDLNHSEHCYLTEGPLISVIVPVYNVKKYLVRCIDSILNQTYQNIEIILVDDGSTDGSLELMKKYVQEDERVQLTQHQQNRGLFQARITGSEFANGKYIAFVDSDDYISIDWFRTLVKKAEDTKADIVVGEWCFDHAGKHKNYINLDPFRLNNYCLEGTDILQAFMEQEGTCFSWTVVWNKLYRKDLWDRCLPEFQNFSQEHGHMLMWEDITFSAGVWSCAQKVVNVHHVLYYYYKHSQASTVINKNKNLKYIADASAAMKFLKNAIKKANCDQKFKANLEHWNANAASMLYHDLVIDNHTHKYEKLIRTAFDFRTEFEERKEFFYSLMTEVHPSFYWQEDIKENITAKETKFVSFDVFDTLVQRPFAEPTDLFMILSDEFNQTTSSYVDFSELRISAERSCREKKNIFRPSAEDITLDEIYNELAETTTISYEKLMQLKEREQELEIQFCEAREAGKMFFDLAIDAGKPIIICSDMYLPKRTVEQILQKANYTGYQELYLSSELFLTKSTGNLYKFVLKDLNCKKASEIMHIGDNWTSDVERAQHCGWRVGHLCKATDILKNYNQGVYSGESYHRIWGRNGQHADYLECMNAFSGLRNVVGLVANRFFANPFVSVNPQSDFNADPNYIGYFGLGTHLLAVCEWALKIAKERNIPTIHFVARDGYIVKKAFDLLNHSDTSTNYIRVSRKSLILADMNTPNDLYSLSQKINILQVSPKKLTEYLKPIIAIGDTTVEAVFKKNDLFYERNFKTISEYKKCVKVLIDQVLDFSLLPAYHAELRQYFTEIIKPGDYIFDIGYSGRPESALSNILGFPVGSLYIHVNSEIAKKRQNQYQCPSECFYGSKPCITGVIREHMMMELGPSTIGYEKVDGKLVPKVEPYKIDYPNEFVTRLIQNAAIDFIKDYCDTFGSFRNAIVLPLEALSAPFEYYLHDSKLFDRQIFAMLPFEDSLGEGGIFNALDFWNQEIHNHCLTTAQNTVIGLPPEMSDLYVDGVFVKFYKMINRWFPHGGLARAVVRKIAGIFIR